jgi:quercetin dioxygenase-like cupin family protein
MPDKTASTNVPDRDVALSKMSNSGQSSPSKPTLQASEGTHPIRILKRAVESVSAGQPANRLVALECVVCPEAVRPPHLHREEDEMFYVLEGQLTYLLNDQIGIANPGASFYVPPGTIHAWRNDGSSDARVLVITRNEPIERFFESWSVSLSRGVSDTASIQRFCQEHNTELFAEPNEFAKPLKKFGTQDGTAPTPAAAFLRPASKQKSPPLQVFGIQIEILLTGDETSDTHCVYQLEIPPQAGLPLYLNKRALESLYITSGQFELMVEGRKYWLQAGDFVSIPPGFEHGLRNIGETTGYVFGQSVPAGNEKFFQLIDRLSREGQLSQSALAKAFRDHGIEPV